MTFASMPRDLRRPLVVGVLLASVFASGLVPALQPAPAQASTATTMETEILGWINHSRASLGLRPLRSSSGLRSLATYRAGVMASTGVLSHTIAGCLSCELNSRGIQWYSYGECIAWTSSSWGGNAAWAIFDWWRHSSTHWALLMSRTFNYVGIGVAYRSSNATTWSSLVLTESVDHTRPTAAMRYGSASGTTVSWGWRGADVLLQTHTAGLKNFDVEYRVDYGTWSVIRSGTTSTSLSVGSRPHGHYYSLRVRSRDWRGNVSYWSASIRVWVP